MVYLWHWGEGWCICGMWWRVGVGVVCGGGVGRGWHWGEGRGRVSGGGGGGGGGGLGAWQRWGAQSWWSSHRPASGPRASLLRAASRTRGEGAAGTLRPAFSLGLSFSWAPRLDSPSPGRRRVLAGNCTQPPSSAADRDIALQSIGPCLFVRLLLFPRMHLLLGT